MRWDLFCRVIDNFGDAGVCWRLARDLASRGDSVRLWIDDDAPLALLAPTGAERVSVQPWPTAGFEAEPADVVVEAFGCELPDTVVASMARAPTPPLWINLEYLSAEAYVERSHGLLSPQSSGPGRGLRKWFYYPGFTAATGGLPREPGLLERRQRFDRDAWLARQGAAAGRGQRVVSLFCYPHDRLSVWLDKLATEPLLLLVAPGPAQAASRAWMASRRAREAGRPGERVRVIELPWLDQVAYDELLWSCDLNIVRGEDSFVRAQWAGAPFLWHIYPQHDGAHALKLDAFVDRLVAGAPPTLAHAVRGVMQGWNGLATDEIGWPDGAAWADLCRRWRDGLASQRDLVSQLQDFCARQRAANC